jgi:hypothetical protein
MLAKAAPVIPDAERAAFDALRADVAALAAVARARPLILRAWSVCTGQATPTQAMTASAEAKALTEMIATRVRAAVTGR